MRGLQAETFGCNDLSKVSSVGQGVGKKGQACNAHASALGTATFVGTTKGFPWRASQGDPVCGDPITGILVLDMVACLL